jgi:hypothetical protein
MQPGSNKLIGVSSCSVPQLQIGCNDLLMLPDFRQYGQLYALFKPIPSHPLNEPLLYASKK